MRPITATDLPAQAAATARPVSLGAGAAVALVLCIGAVAFCGWQLLVEARVARAFATLDDMASGPIPALDAAADATPREKLYASLSAARRAARLPQGSAARSALLDAAEHDGAIARSARPHWADAWVAAAYLASVRDGEKSPAVRAALIRSYREARFLRDSAEWRVRMAIANWDALPRPVQDEAAREAVLLARTSRAMALHIRIITVGTPLYERYGGVVWPNDRPSGERSPTARLSE